MARMTAIAFVNARIRTGDARRPWADAILIRHEHIDALGSSAEVRKMSDAAVRVVDLGGRTVSGSPDTVLRVGGDASLVVYASETGADGDVVLDMVRGEVITDRDGLIRP